MQNGVRPLFRTSHSAFRIRLRFALGFAQAGNAFARLPLAPFLKQFETLKAFQNITFAAQGGGCAKTAML
jgi:hypothetical protein